MGIFERNSKKNVKTLGSRNFGSSLFHRQQVQFLDITLSTLSYGQETWPAGPQKWA